MGLSYVTGTRKRTACTRNYVAQVHAVKEDTVKVCYLRKYQNLVMGSIDENRYRYSIDTSIDT